MMLKTRSGGGGCGEEEEGGQRSTGSHVTGSRSKVKVKVIQDGGAHVGGYHGNGGCVLSNA